jgi:protein-S-isoprenylcysteine O-methyltransferase Ste14
MAEQPQDAGKKNLWQRMNGPAKIGVVFAAIGIILTVIGVFRDPTTPVTAWSIGMGTLISGATWGVVSWAIATAAVEVEHDLAQNKDEVV